LNKTDISPHILSLIAILLFSTIEVAGKLIGAEISPYAVTAWRFLIGGLLILPFAIKELTSGKRKIKLTDIFHCAVAGVLNVCLSMLFLQLAVVYGKASLSAIIISTNTLFVAFFAWLFLKEKITRLHIIGLTGGLIGLIFILSGEKSAYLNSPNLALGILFSFGAALTFGLYTVFSKKIIQDLGNYTTLSFSFLLGSVGLLLYSILTKKALTFTLNSSNISFLIYLGLFVTGIAYILYFSAIRQIGASKASLYFFLKPAAASFLAFLFCKETLNGIQLAGIVIIMLSLSREALVKLLPIPVTDN